MSWQRHSFPFVQGLTTNWIVNTTTLYKLGYWGKAPGTVGSAVGIIWYIVFFMPFALFFPLLAGLFYYCMLLLVSVYFSMGFCQEAENRLFEKDPGYVILDEFVAMPIVYFGIQFYWMGWDHIWVWIALGFLYFRIFDIAKPLGIKRLQELPGGIGVVMDDLAAALAANLCLQLTCSAAHAAGLI